MLATESDRLQYLSALGITQYRARAPLPCAAPSLVLQLSDLAALTSAAQMAAAQPTTASATHTASAAAAPAKQVSDAATGAASAAPVDRQATPSMQSGASAALSAISTLAQPEAATQTPTSDTSAQATTAQTEIVEAAPASNTQPFHCQLALWQQGDLFILADVSQLQAADIQLLKNILTACGRSAQLAAPQQFSWPLAKRRNSAFNEAREHFLGLLDASLAQTPVQQLISFGAQSLRLLTADHESADQLSDVDCQHLNLQAINFAHRWPLTALPSLTQMLQQPARYKPLAWQLLQSRIAL